MIEPKAPAILVVAQQKGGVGKTTLSKTLGIYGAREDLAAKRVLLVDVDFQASLSKLLLNMDYSAKLGSQPPVHPDHNPKEDPEWNGRSSSADIFFDGYVVPYPIRYPYPIKGLEILPAHKARLQDVEEQDRTALRDRVLNRLHDFMMLPEVRDNYDLIIIDTGPKESPLVRTALRAATHMVLPITLEQQCLDGLEEMLGMWRKERSQRPPERPLTMAGVVVNRYDARYASHNAFLAQVSRDEVVGPLLCPEILPQRAAVAEQDTRGARPPALFDLPKSADIRETALELCANIFGKMFPAEAARFRKLRPSKKYAAVLESVPAGPAVAEGVTP